ncbi:MAG: hypothetical protein IIB38_08585, partial [Candidatus Hydrogenedentes bacterium]|nr:hypothetical protein [Candidatus Hydrogenedentota bacterium]
EGLVTPVGNDFLYLAVRVLDDNVQGWFAVGAATPNVQKLGVVGGHGAADGIDGSKALTPWVMVQARAGAASRTLSLRRMRITGAIL